MSVVTQSSFEQFKKLTNEKLDKILTAQAQVSTKLDSISAEIKFLKDEAVLRDHKISELKLALDDQKTQSDSLEKRQLAFEVKKRKKLNLLIYGLPEEKVSEKIEVSVSNFIRNQLEVTEPINLMKCYRITLRSSNVIDTRQRG